MSQDAIVSLVKLFFAGLVVLAVAMFLVRPLWRLLTTRPDESLLVPTFNALGEEEEELQIPSEEKGLDRGAVIEQARGDPRLTAQFVSQWLKSKQ